jgi:hypothetical protein
MRGGLFVSTIKLLGRLAVKELDVADLEAGY